MELLLEAATMHFAVSIRKVRLMNEVLLRQRLPP